MNTTSLLSKVNARSEVRSYLEWHCQNRVPLHLLSGSHEGHLSAYVTAFDDASKTIRIVCLGMPDTHRRSNLSYAVIGCSPSGARFLASGEMSAESGETDNFTLSFPQWLDVSQARDCYRCATPAGYAVHFTSLEPHLNDQTCQIRNISLEGMAVVWDNTWPAPTFSVGDDTEPAILQAKDGPIPLGRLRVAHITQKSDHLLVGLTFKRVVPHAFVALALDIQRAALANA